MRYMKTKTAAVLLSALLLFAGCSGLADESTSNMDESSTQSSSDNDTLGTAGDTATDSAAEDTDTSSESTAEDTGEAESSTSPDTDVSDNTADAVTISDLSSDLAAYFDDEDADASYDASSATNITLEDVDTKVAGSGASFSDGTVMITAEGTYILSGSLDGTIVVDAPDEALVRLVFDGVTLTNDTSAPVNIKSADKTVLILADGSTNTVSDADTYLEQDAEDEPNAAIFSKDDLSVTGSGSLTVTGNYNHGISSKDDLIITGGTYDITAAGDALRGNDGVAVLTGSFKLSAGDDGIQSNTEDEADKGYVVLAGGSFTIGAMQDGIQAARDLMIADGSYAIRTGAGSTNASTSTYAGGKPGAAASDTGSGDDSSSMKGLKAAASLTVTGGTFTIDAEDDAVHSNDSITIGGGTFTIQTGDDGFHADGTTKIMDGVITIEASYEGIEGAAVELTGGSIDITASDDAINAAGGSDDTEAQGFGARDNFSSSGDYYVRISGGAITATGGLDTIDSNGDLYLEGGTVTLSGASRGMDGAIDLDGVFTVTGGTLLAAGSTTTPSNDSTQPVIILSHASQIASGSTITLKDADGKELISYKIQTDISYSAYTSPQLKSGQTYTVYVDGSKLTEVTLSGTVTTMADNGGSYSAPEGFGGGGMPGGGGGRR